MAGSRAAGAREPGQIREEAALSDTVRAPRISLAGADDRRARPGAGFEGGCTVRFPGQMDNVALIRSLVERWNAGDVDGVLDLYADDAAIVTSPDWPEPATWRGRSEIRASIADWREVWQSSTAELERLEALGDKVLAIGAWASRGRASGVDGRMPIAIIFTVRDGKIALHEWFIDHDSAIAAARGD
jgi:ketosteroid isomerase-like protein